MPLSKYRDKRDFKATREPYGKISKQKKALRFVMQKHGARHLHYDLRLEIGGVLKSWAVPKGPSLDPNVKRLAVQVEDHPLEYSKFEGNIPHGEYGAGAVIIWDKGTWQTDDNAKSLEKGALTFTLKGKKLKGKWKLIQIKKDPKNWLLIKVKDEYAVSEKEYSILEEDKSVISNKSLFEVKDEPLPKVIHPQLATLVDKAPIGKEWLHEIKFDGYRLLCFIEDKIKFITRGQQDWTSKFEKLASQMRKLKELQGTVLDGEVVALDQNNHFNFQMLQNALHHDKKIHLVYYVFDLIYYKGKDISHLELLERKKILKKILAKLNSNAVRYSDHVIGKGQQTYKNACQMSLEGIMSKNIHSEYDQKRSKNWLKVKCTHRQEFVVGGVTKPKGSRGHFGSLLLGYYDENKDLHYCGHVGTGFDNNSLKDIFLLLNKHTTAKSPFVQPPIENNLLTWLRPKIVIEVEFLEWTSDGMLRHPSFKGIREDKAPSKAFKEEKEALPFPLSHPDKVLYPKTNRTKLDIATYYDNIAEWILPYIINRPLTVLRCPKGVGDKCFYQRHSNPSNKAADKKGGAHVIEQTGIEKYLYIKNKKGLLNLVQMDVLEMHPWGARVDKIERPDWVIFDLDPGEEVAWKNVIKAAFRVKEELEKLDLTSFVKTTGGKGLHIVIPLQRRYSWEDVFHFSKVFAQFFVAKYPTEYIDVMTKSKRKNKIFIDYLRNHRGATAIAPYSTRANAMEATIATPLSWAELTPKIKSDYYTLENLPKRLNSLKKDPWEDFFEIKQKLPRVK